MYNTLYRSHIDSTLRRKEGYLDYLLSRWRETYSRTLAKRYSEQMNTIERGIFYVAADSIL